MSTIELLLLIYFSSIPLGTISYLYLKRADSHYYRARKFTVGDVVVATLINLLPGVGASISMAFLIVILISLFCKYILEPISELELWKKNCFKELLKCYSCIVFSAFLSSRFPYSYR